VSAIATHAVFPGDSLDKIRATGLFDRIVVTDSHPRAIQLQDGFLTVKSVAPLVAGHLTSSLGGHR
jgi:ribose-phosphate pyrophosphokinase